MREWLARLADWLRRDQLDAELIEELRFHRERLERDVQLGGVPAHDAKRLARRRLGNLTRVREETRERWSVPWLDHFAQDLRYALRGLRRSPGFTTSVVMTLGLGIGANTAMFGVIDHLMFRPHAYLRDPESVHRVYLQTTSAGRTTTTVTFPYTRYLDLRNGTTSFSQYAAFLSATLAVGLGESAREREIAAVSASFFDFFDAPPALGRFFAAAEDTPPVGASVAVLSHAFWRTEYGGRDVIGESIHVGNASWTIIGVAPEGFTGVAEDRAPTLFVPVTTHAVVHGGGSGSDYFVKYNWDWVQMMVRRRPGIPVAAATTDLTNAFIQSRVVARAVHPLYARTEQLSPRAVAGALRTAAGPDPGLEARTMVWVTAVAAIVLLIACANVANLVLARALRRRRETALRLALGVTRRRLAAQSLTETLLLAMLGCAVGVGVAQWGGTALRRLVLPNASAFDVALDARTLGVALAAALLAGLAAGLAPVIFSGREDITTSLKAGARDGMYRHSRTRSVLLVMQGALSVVLLVGAGLFVRSLTNVRSVRLGYDADAVLMVQWEERGMRLGGDARVANRRRLLETARALPAVSSGAWVSSVPFQGTSIMVLSVPGIDSVARLGRFTYQTAGPDYFTTMRTRILRGRSFTDADRIGTPPVAVVSEGMAGILWPAQDAIGQCLRISRSVTTESPPCTTVVGVAEDAVHNPVADQRLRYYVPIDQASDIGGSTLLLRMRGDPADRVDEVRRALQAELPGRSYVTVRLLRELVDRQRRSWLMGAAMFVGFGLLALIVAAVGLYGVIAYDVAQRMHELGIRIALGAGEGDVVRLVIGRGMRLALTGVAIGSGLAVVAGRWIEPVLFQQSARDPMVFGVVALTLTLVGLLASALPAMRAARADPNMVLRTE